MVWGNGLILGDWPPDPYRSPHLFLSLTLTRCLAYLIDATIIGTLIVVLHLALGVLTVASLGLLFPLHFLVVPIFVALTYHSLQLSGPASATLGMRILGLRAYGMRGVPPTLPQAVAHTCLFYGSLAFCGGLFLVVALFNSRRRTIHDYLAGILILRS